MNNSPGIPRRTFLKNSLYAFGALLIGGFSGFFRFGKQKAEGYVWQIDPDLCSYCGLCETNCVLSPSAVKTVHAYAICGYCDLCSGYLRKGHTERNTAAENLLCLTAAIKRAYIEDPYYEYIIDEKLCIACGLCVKGCTSFGNGSLFLQIKHNICINCNQCSIARNCPSRAIHRVPVSKPYKLKTSQENA